MVGYTHKGKIPKTKQPEYLHKITHIFSSDGWSTETNGRIFIYNENFDGTIELNFNDETTDIERELGLRKYGIKVESKFQDFWKTRKTQQTSCEEHQRFQDEFSHKIIWEKQFFNLMGNEMRKVIKKRKLRQKRK